MTNNSTNAEAMKASSAGTLSGFVNSLTVYSSIALIIYFVYFVFARLYPTLYHPKARRFEISNKKGLFEFSMKKLSLESFKALYVSLLDFILLGFKATAISSPTKVVGATEVGDGDSSFPSLSKRGKGKRLLGASGKSHPPTSTAQPADEDEDAIRLFMKLMAYLFLFFSLIIPLVLLPINSKGGKELGGLAGMTITNIDPSSTAAATSNDNAQASFYVAGNPVFWAHVTMSYILVLPTLVLVFFLYSSTARLRHKYLIRNALNPQILNGKILLVRDIPPNTSATALYQYFHRIFPGKIIQVNLDQNEGQLFAVQQQLEYHRNKLETAITTYMIRLSKYLHKKRGLIRQPTVPTIDASDEPDSITKETAPKEYHPRPSTNSMVGSTVVLDGFQDNDGNTYKMETITGPPPPDTRASSSIVQSSRFEESGNEADETNDNNPRTATLRSAGSISSIRMDGEELRLKKLLRPRHLKSIFNLNFIDTIDYNIDCIEKLKHQKSNIMINQPNYLSTWAFVVFNDVAACRLAYRGVCFQSNPLKGSTNHGDFDPEKDLIWKSLSISPYSRILRTTGSFLSITAITVFWGVLTAAITSSLSFESLSLVFPWLQKATDQNTVIASFLKGVAPTIAIFILLSVVPLFARIGIEFEGRVNRSDIDLTIYRRMFVFYVINVLLITILTDTLLKTIVTYLEDPSGLLAALGSSLPSVSSFFINYVMLLGLLGPCIRLLGIERIILAELTLRFFARTPREIHSLTKCIQFSPGVLLAEHSLVATIGLVYGVVAPVVLFFVAFYFGVWYLVYSHLFRKSYIVAHCNGGLILADATKNLFIGIFLHQVMMIAFFFSSKAILPGCLILILLFLTIIIQHISRQYGGIIEQLPLQTIASKLPPDAEQISTISTTSPQKRKSVVVGLKDETAPSTTTTATVAATNDDCVSVLSVNSVNVNLESTPGTLKIVAAHATYSGGRKKLTPTLESSLAPCSPSTRLELWIPSDRYSLLETFILPGLAPYDFTIRTDGASMDEHGRMTIESNTG